MEIILTNTELSKKLLREHLIALNLFCLYPFLTFYANNTTEYLDLQLIALTWAVFLLICMSMLLVLWKSINDELYLRKSFNIFLV